MPSTVTDRLQGLTTSVAVKAPCRVATTANITLSGLQAINGISVAEDDRVLVWQQSATTENGIYTASSSAWERTKDFDGNRDVVQGTLVPVVNGASGSNLYEVTAADPIVIDSTGITFSLRYGANIRFDQTAGEIAASVTPSDFAYLPGDIRRYGALINGTADDTTAWNNALLSNSSVYFPAGTSIVSSIAPRSGTLIHGDGPGSILKQKVTAEFINVITFNSKSRLTLRDFEIDGNGAAQPSGEHKHGVDIEESTDVIVDSLTVHDCQGDAIYIASATDPVTSKRITVRDCRIYNIGRQGITVAGKGARNVLIENNHVRVGTYVTSSTSHGNCIHLEMDSVPTNYSGDIVIQGNTCLDTGISSSGTFSGLSIMNNTIRLPIYTGSPWGIGLVNPRSFVVSGNTIVGDNSTVIDGIYIQDSGPSSTARVKTFAITGNVVEMVAGHGITIFGTGSGIPSLGQLSVTGNVIQTIGTGTTKNGINILSAYKDAVIADNVIRTTTNLGIVIQGSPDFIISDNKVAECAGSYGIFADVQGSVGAGPGLITGNFVSWATPAGKTGINVTSNSANTRISVYGNELGNTATPVTFGGSAVKCSSWGNVGGNDALTGSFTLGAAATTVVNNANVTAGCRILLQPTNAAAGTLMGSAKALYISARTAGTSFTVATASAASAAGTETFDYYISV